MRQEKQQLYVFYLETSLKKFNFYADLCCFLKHYREKSATMFQIKTQTLNSEIYAFVVRRPGMPAHVRETADAGEEEKGQGRIPGFHPVPSLPLRRPPLLRCPRNSHESIKKANIHPDKFRYFRPFAMRIA